MLNWDIRNLLNVISNALKGENLDKLSIIYLIDKNSWYDLQTHKIINESTVKKKLIEYDYKYADPLQTSKYIVSAMEMGVVSSEVIQSKSELNQEDVYKEIEEAKVTKPNKYQMMNDKEFKQYMNSRFR